MRTVLKYLRNVLLYGTWFGGVTLVFFVPLGFHHDLSFGMIPLLSFLYLDGEGMAPGGYSWHGYEVHFFVFRFLITIVLWLVSLVLVYRWVRYLDSKAYVS